MSTTGSPLFLRGRRLAPAIAAALLAACSSAPQYPGGTGVAVVTEHRPGSPRVARQLPASAWEGQFIAAEAALAEFDWMDAELALAPLQDAGLDDSDSARLAYLRARIAHVRGREGTAIAELAALEHTPLPPALADQVYGFHREILDLSGGYLDSARLGVTAMTLAPAERQAALKQGIWRDLERLDTRTLDTALATSQDSAWEGWLQLALIARGPDTDREAALAKWRDRYPGHPASHPLPGGLDDPAAALPAGTTVALVLPLSGRFAPAGRAVRDGYLAGYFRARQQGGGPARVLVLDIDDYAGAADAYRDAVARGAQLVVGPLRREDVAAVTALGDLPVPLLALNRLDVPADGGEPVQLSLAPEDEVRRLAERAFGDGARRILLLRPAGPWGDKVEETLAGRWRELGGSIASDVVYTGANEYSEAVKSGLGIAASEARRHRVRDMLATNVEFTPRRRQDLDAVFMLSRSPEEARALKPLLAFHYAGALPVYAPSSVYGGHPDPRDRDLNGLRLVEIPWLLDDTTGLKAELAAAGDDQYPHLNALGVDAFLLQSRIAQLQRVPGVIVRGSTGLLSLNDAQQVERELPLAEFDGGELTPR